MATADVGIRIVLEDGTGPGFGALNSNLRSMGGLLGALAYQWQSFSPTMQLAGVTAAASGLLFAGFVSAIKYSVNAAEELQFSIERVIIAMDGAGQHTDQLQQTIISLANTSQFTSSQIADGFVALGQHAITFSDIMNTDVAQSMIDLAEATQTQTVPAANLLTSVLQMFNLKAKDSRMVVDALAYSFDHGVNSLSQMQQAYDQFGPIAASLRISFQESTAVLDVLNQQFNSGTASGTAFKYILQSFVSPTQQAANEFAALGLIAMDKTNPALQQLEAQLRANGSAGKAVANAFDGSGGTVTAFQAMYKEAQKLGIAQSDMNFQAWSTKVGAMSDALYNSKGQFIGLEAALQLIHDKMIQAGMSTHDVTQALELMFSKTGAKGALALLQDWTATEAKLKQVNAGLAQHGTAATKAEQITSTYKIQVQELQTSFKDLAAEIGLQILPVLTLLVSHLNGFIGFLQKLGPHFALVAAATLVFGAAFTGLTFVISAAIFLFGALDFILLPVLAVLGILVGVIALVVGAVILLRQHWQQIAPVLAPVISAFRLFGTFLGAVFREMGNDVVGWWHMISSNFGSLVPQLRDTWNNLVHAVQAATPVWKVVGVVLGVVGAVIGGVLIGAFHGLLLGLTVLVKGLLIFLVGAAQVFSGIMQLALAFEHFILALFQMFFQLLTGQNLTALTHMETAWNSMKTAVIDIAKGLWNIIVGLFTVTVGTLIGIISGFVLGMIHWFQHLFDTLVGHSIVTDLVHTIVSLFQWLLGAGPAVISAMVSAVIAQFSSLFSSVTSQASGFVDRVRGVLGGIGGILQGVVGAFQSMSGGIAGAISGALGWINSLIGAISGALSAASSAGHSIGSALHIPGFAGGGIVTSPTFAMVGEGGEPEVILPVSKMIQAAQLAANGNQGGNGTLSIQLNIDGQTMSQVVLDRVSGRLLMNGAGRAMN